MSSAFDAAMICNDKGQLGSESAKQMDSSLLDSQQSPTTEAVKAKVAFISGHIDLPKPDFLRHYKTRLDNAINAGDFFILSNAGGADTLALQYLLFEGVSPSQITAYLHTPSPSQKSHVKTTRVHVDKSKTESEAIERHRQMGLNVKVIRGSHADRDATMTEESDYDILWVRSNEETKALYGKKYRPGRVSGTMKNAIRRDELRKNDSQVTPL